MKTSSLLQVAALAVSSLLLPQASQAGTIVGETSDGLIRSSAAGTVGAATQNQTATQLRVGNWNAGSGQNLVGVYVFELPDLGAVANPFDTATLTFTLNSLSGAFTYNADLYGIDARASSALDATDFWVGDATDPDAAKLQDSILTSSTSVGTIVSGDISGYLNAQYDSGANIGKFVFLRLNRDGDTELHDEVTGYLVAAADDGSNQPFLTYTVPEPSAYALLAGFTGMVSVMVRRRRA